MVAGGSPMRPAAYWVGPIWIFPASECAGGKDDGRRFEMQPGVCNRTAYSVPFKQQVVHFCLEYVEACLAFNHLPDCGTV